jgi:hypothetical protein
MKALPTWREQAYLMLTNAAILNAAQGKEDFGFTPRIDSLALDLQSLFEEMRDAYEGYDPDPYVVSAELCRRIGGLKNLESYSDCLLAKRGGQ